MSERSVEIPPLHKAPEKRLDSWKEIASYVNRDVTTVQRWEKREGMPVHRHVHATRGSVYALTDELDAWAESRRALGSQAEATASAEAIAVHEDGRGAGSRGYRWLILAGVASIGLATVAWLGLRDRKLPASPPPIRSLAVLPLKNLSGDPSQEYLADGMTEALIGRLSAIHDLRVISHTSVMRFRDPQVSAPEVARILGVDALVEGSVIREGSRIRITAQLIRGATDEHFWSATYDREMRDALTMQSELAESIAEKVEVSVTGDEHRRFTATRPVAPEVYESYLKGLYGQTHGNAEQSAADFEDAIHKDATFAPAYLGLAEVWTGLGSVAGGVSPAEARPKVIGFARQALALDPDLVAAHVILANVLQEEWHWAEAETEYRRALDLNPNDPLARSGFALWLLCEGRTDEAVAWIQSARKLDPTAVTGHDVSGFFSRRTVTTRRSASPGALSHCSRTTSLPFRLWDSNWPRPTNRPRPFPFCKERSLFPMAILLQQAYSSVRMHAPGAGETRWRCWRNCVRERRLAMLPRPRSSMPTWDSTIGSRPSTGWSRPTTRNQISCST